VVYAGYVGHIRADQARETGIDVVVLAFALINKLDKIGAPLTQLIFSHWFADDSRGELIAGGMTCGVPFGTVYGLYLIASSFERACRNSPYGTPVQVDLWWVRIAYCAGMSLLIGFGAWHAFKLADFLADVDLLCTILAAGLLSGFGVFCLYAAFSWFAYWATIAGHGLWRSMRKFG
jgi:hypothetical protein